MKISETIINFQLFLLGAIIVAEGGIANDISYWQGNKPTNAYSFNTQAMDGKVSAVLTTKALHHKELLFIPRVPNHSSASSYKEVEKTAAHVSIVFYDKTSRPENIQKTRDIDVVDRNRTRNHAVSVSEVPDIESPLKTLEQIEIRETPLETLHSGMHKTVIPLEPTVTDTEKGFTISGEREPSVHFSQTVVKYTDSINTTSSLDDKSPKASMSGKYTSDQTSFTPGVKKLTLPLNSAIPTQMLSRAFWSTDVGAIKTAVRFSSVASTSYKYISSASVTENNLENLSRPTTSLMPTPAGKPLELSASRFISSESRISPKLFNSTTGTAASAEKQKIFGSAILSSSTLETSNTRFTESLSRKVRFSTEEKKSPYSTEPSRATYSVAPLTRRVVVPALSRDVSENIVGSTAGASGVEFSVSRLLSSSVRLQSKAGSTIFQIFPSPSITRRHFDISPSNLRDSSPRSLVSQNTSSPINVTQELSKTQLQTLLSKKTFKILEIKDTAAPQNILSSQTFSIESVAMERKTLKNRTFTSEIMKPNLSLTASIFFENSATVVQNFNTVEKEIANARTSTFDREYKMGYTQSKFQLSQSTPSLIIAQESFTTALFTSKPLAQRIATRKVSPTFTTAQVVSSTHSKDASRVSVWLVESPSIGVPSSPTTTIKDAARFYLTDTVKRTINTVFQKEETITSVRKRTPTQVPLSSPTPKTVNVAKNPGGTHGDASVATTVITVLSAAQQTSRLPMLLAIALIPSILLIIFVFAFFVWRHRRKKNSGPVYNITVEYADQARSALTHQNSWIDLAIKEIHIDLEFPNSEKRKSAIVSTAPQKGLSEVQMREFQLPKLRQTIAKPKECSLSWLNGIIKRQIEIPLPESDERSSTSTRRPLSVYSAKEKENFEPSEKVTRHESLKCTREIPLYEVPKIDQKAPYLHELELTNEGFDISMKEKNKQTNRESIAPEDGSFVCACTENQNEVSQTLENKKQKLATEEDIAHLPKPAVPIKPSKVNNDFNKPNVVVDNCAKRYDVELEDTEKDNSLLPIPSRRRVLLLRSRFESL